jgi:hypothetical protein
MQKPIAGYLVGEMRAILFPERGAKGSNAAGLVDWKIFSRACVAVAGVGVIGGKGGEVVLAEDIGGGLDHGIYLDRPIHGVDVAGEEWGAEFVAEDPVFIGFLDRAVAGVELGRDDFGGEDTDRCGQFPVEGALQVSGWDRRGEGEGGYLTQSVDPGIGASGTLRENPLADDVRDRVRQGSLDRWLARLDLPTAVVAAVVGQDQFPVLGCGGQFSCSGTALFIHDTGEKQSYSPSGGKKNWLNEAQHDWLSER